MTAETNDGITAEPLLPGDAYALLSKPTLQLTDEDIRKIASDLRAKRQRFLQGIADKPAAKRSSRAAVDDSPEAKAARTESLRNDLLGGLKL